MNIVLPSPSLVLLVGPPYVGKTTFARNQFPRSVVVSSDDVRARVTGSSGDMSQEREVWYAVQSAVECRLRGDQTAVVDAMNIGHENREPLIRVASQLAVPTSAIVLLASLARLQKHAALRMERPVPWDIVRSAHAKCEDELSSILDEGFDEVYILNHRDAAATHLEFSVRSADL